MINNSGGLVHVDASKTELEDLSSLLELQLIVRDLELSQTVKNFFF